MCYLLISPPLKSSSSAVLSVGAIHSTIRLVCCPIYWCHPYYQLATCCPIYWCHHLHNQVVVLSYLLVPPPQQAGCTVLSNGVTPSTKRGCCIVLSIGVTTLQSGCCAVLSIGVTPSTIRLCCPIYWCHHLYKQVDVLSYLLMSTRLQSSYYAGLSIRPGVTPCAIRLLCCPIY